MTAASFSSPLIETTATIPSAGTDSEDLDLGGLRLFAILTPAAVTGANLSFEVSPDGATWYPLVDEAGAAISVPMAATQAISLGNLFQHFVAWQYLRLVSDAAEGADRDFTVVTRHV